MAPIGHRMINDLRRWITLVETEALILYHVTPTRNLPKIMQQGLLPKIGSRARLLNEPVKAIYLFHSQDEAADGVANWLGDAFGESTRLALLAVRVPMNAITEKGAGYETILTEPLPASHITIISRNL